MSPARSGRKHGGRRFPADGARGPDRLVRRSLWLPAQSDSGLDSPSRRHDLLLAGRRHSRPRRGMSARCGRRRVQFGRRSGASLSHLPVAIDREPEFQRIEARSRAVQVVALALLIVAGGAIVTSGASLPAGSSKPCCVRSVRVVAWAMVEPPPCEEQTANDEASERRTSVPWRMVALLILPLAFLDAAGSTGSFLLQTTGERGPAAVTLLVALITLANAAGSALATRLPTTSARVHPAAMAIGSLLIAVALAVPAARVPATIALSFGTGVLHPLRAAAIQRLASDGVRARAASAASACDMALSTLFLLLAGGLLARRK